MVAGRLLRQAVTTAKRIINKVACEHKVGMCICPHRRVIGYIEQDDRKFQPWLMCLLASTSTKEGAHVMEAAIILELEREQVNLANNINYTTSMDYGGEGPKNADEAQAQHFVYLAVAPVPAYTARA